LALFGIHLQFTVYYKNILEYLPLIWLRYVDKPRFIDT
jgi:hypothetical protein